jgi:hypothetical protein
VLPGTILVGAWCLAAALGLGFPLAVRLAPRHGAATRTALAFLLGSALLSHAVLALGLLGWLRPLPMLGLLVALSVPVVRHRGLIGELLRAMTGDAAESYRDSGAPERALVLVAAGLTALGLVIPLFPTTNADALAYATALPARFAHDGRIQFYPDSFESAFILLNETLHVIGDTLHVRPTGVWFEVAAQMLLFFAAADCYRAFWGDERRGSAYLFGTALLLTPLVQLMPFMTKAHLLELLAIVVATTLVLQAPRKGGWSAAAACVAVAVATKYVAGVGVVALLAPSALLGWWRGRQRPRAVGVLGVAALVAVLALPFYVRNLAWTGNPVFPFGVAGLTSSFHLRHHDAWITSLLEVEPAPGRTPTDLFLWWLRVSLPPLGDSASYIGTFALAFLPLALVVRPRPRRLVDLVVGFVAATLALFVLSAHLTRYFLAPVVALTMLGTAGWDSRRAASRPACWTGFALLLALGCLWAAPLKLYGVAVHAPALLSRAGQARVLERTTPWYEDFQRLRALVAPEQPILCMLRNCQYLANSRREDVFFRLAERAEEPGGGIDPRPVWQGLRAQGIRHVVALESTTLGNAGAPTVLAWLARCGGRPIYRNPTARLGTRDPRHVATVGIVLIELTDALDDQAAHLLGSCRRPTTAW